jgi:hypothetical protein
MSCKLASTQALVEDNSATNLGKAREHTTLQSCSQLGKYTDGLSIQRVVPANLKAQARRTRLGNAKVALQLLSDDVVNCGGKMVFAIVNSLSR